MIVIPMAGISRRFQEAGYTLPKYMLPLNGDWVFRHAVGSFSLYFKTEPFLFVARQVAETEEFVTRECQSLGISNAQIVILDRETHGQAETVELGLVQSGVGDHEPVTIFNIDTFRTGLIFPEADCFEYSDGYLEVFCGSGSNWSYVAPAEGTNEPLVARTAEKEPISDLCCSGLYHFRRATDFFSALAIKHDLHRSQSFTLRQFITI